LFIYYSLKCPKDAYVIGQSHVCRSKESFIVDEQVINQGLSDRLQERDSFQNTKLCECYVWETEMEKITILDSEWTITLAFFSVALCF